MITQNTFTWPCPLCESGVFELRQVAARQWHGECTACRLTWDVVADDAPTPAQLRNATKGWYQDGLKRPEAEDAAAARRGRPAPDSSGRSLPGRMSSSARLPTRVRPR